MDQNMIFAFYSLGEYGGVKEYTLFIDGSTEQNKWQPAVLFHFCTTGGSRD